MAKQEFNPLDFNIDPLTGLVTSNAPVVRSGQYTYFTENDRTGLPSRKELNEYGIPSYYSDDLSERLSNAQPYLNKVGRQSINTLSNIVTGTIGLGGTLGEAVSYGLMGITGNLEREDLDFSNAITRWSERNRDPLKVYWEQEPESLGGSLASLEWWTRNGLGLVESIIQFGITGMGVGMTTSKVATRLAKALQSTTKTAQGLSTLQKGLQAGAQLTTAGTLAYTEGALSGARIYKDTYEAAIDRKLTEDQARHLAGTAAAKTVLINTVINSALNFPSVNAIFRTTDDVIERINKEVRGDAISLQREKLGELSKDFTSIISPLKKEMRQSYIREAGLESVEELVNVFAERRGEVYGQLIQSESVFDSLREVITSKEGITSMILGAIGGAGQNVIMNETPLPTNKDEQGRNRSNRQSRLQDMEKRGQAYAKSLYEDLAIYEEAFNELTESANELEAIHKQMSKVDSIYPDNTKTKLERAELVKRDEELRKKYSNALDKMFMLSAYNSVKKGSTEVLRAHFDNIKGTDFSTPLAQTLFKDEYAQLLQRNQELAEQQKMIVDERKKNDDQIKAYDKVLAQPNLEDREAVIQQREEFVNNNKSLDQQLQQINEEGKGINNQMMYLENNTEADYKGLPAEREMKLKESAEYFSSLLGEVEVLYNNNSLPDFKAKVDEFITNRQYEEELKEINESDLEPELKEKAKKQIEQEKKKAIKDLKAKAKESEKVRKEFEKRFKEEQRKQKLKDLKNKKGETDSNESEEQGQGRESTPPPPPDNESEDDDQTVKPQSTVFTYQHSNGNTYHLLADNTIVREDADGFTKVPDSTKLREALVNEFIDQVEVSEDNLGNQLISFAELSPLQYLYDIVKGDKELLSQAQSVLGQAVANDIFNDKSKTKERRKAYEDFKRATGLALNANTYEALLDLFVVQASPGGNVDSNQVTPDQGETPTPPPTTSDEDSNESEDDTEDDSEENFDNDNGSTPVEIISYVTDISKDGVRVANRASQVVYENSRAVYKGDDEIDYHEADQVERVKEGSQVTFVIEKDNDYGIISDSIYQGSTKKHITTVRELADEIAILKNKKGKSTLEESELEYMSRRYNMHVPIAIMHKGVKIGYVPNGYTTHRGLNDKDSLGLRNLIIDQGLRKGVVNQTRPGSGLIVKRDGKPVQGKAIDRLGSDVEVAVTKVVYIDQIPYLMMNEGKKDQSLNSLDSFHEDSYFYNHSVNGGVLYVKLPFDSKDKSPRFVYKSLVQKRINELERSDEIVDFIYDYLVNYSRSKENETHKRNLEPKFSNFKRKVDGIADLHNALRDFVYIWEPNPEQEEYFTSQGINGKKRLQWLLENQYHNTPNELIPHMFYVDNYNVYIYNASQATSSNLGPIVKMSFKEIAQSTRTDETNDEMSIIEKFIRRTVSDSYLNFSIEAVNDRNYQRKVYGNLMEVDMILENTTTSSTSIEKEGVRNFTAGRSIYVVPASNKVDMELSPEDVNVSSTPEVSEVEENEGSSDDEVIDEIDGIFNLPSSQKSSPSSQESSPEVKDKIYSEDTLSDYLQVLGLTMGNLSSVEIVDMATIMAKEVTKNVFKTGEITAPKSVIHSAIADRVAQVRKVITKKDGTRRTAEDFLKLGLTEDRIFALFKMDAINENDIDSITTITLLQLRSNNIIQAKGMIEGEVKDEVDLKSTSDEGINWDDYGSFVENHRNTASIRIKSIMSQVGALSKEGLPLTNTMEMKDLVGYDKVYNTAKSALARYKDAQGRTFAVNAQWESTPDGVGMKEALLKAADTYPFLGKETLTKEQIENGEVGSGLVDILESMDESIRNLFVSNMASHALDMHLMQYTILNNTVQYTRMLANANDLRLKIVRDWKSAASERNFITYTSEGEVLNKSIIEEVLDDLVDGKGNPVNLNYTQVSNILSKLGIDIHEDTFNKLANKKSEDSEQLWSFTKLRKGIRLSQIDRLSNVFNDLHNILSKNEDVININEFYPSSDKKGKALQNLAKADLVFRSHEITQSFRSADKTIYGFSYNKLAFDTMNRMLQDDNYLQELSNTNFSGIQRDQYGNKIASNLILETLIENGQRGNAISLSYAGIEAIKEAYSKTHVSNFTEKLSETDHEWAKVMYYFAPVTTSVDNSATFFFPTLSDKKVIYFLTAPKVVQNRGVNYDIDEVYKYLVAPELNRIFTSGTSPENTVNAKGYNPEMFYMFPGLNTVLSESLEASDTVEELERKLKAKLEELLENEIDKKYQDWTNKGIIGEENKRSMIPKSIYDEVSQGSKGLTFEEKTRRIVAEYYINNAIATMSIYQTFIGDPAFFYKKGSELESVSNYSEADFTADVIATFNNIGKRSAMQNSPGTSLRFDYTTLDTKIKEETGWDFINYKQLVVNEPIDKSRQLEYLANIFKAKSPNKTIAAVYQSAYEEIASADAQELTTAQEHAWVMWRKGELTDNQFEQIIYLLEEGKDLPSDLLNAMLVPIGNPHKPVYSSNRIMQGDMRPVFIKSSSFPLLPQLTKGTELDKVRKFMEGGKINRIAYSSAVKVGSPNKPVSLWGGENNEQFLGDIEEGWVDKAQSSVLPLHRRYFRMQLEIPTDKKKDKTGVGTQESKLLFSNIRDLTIKDIKVSDIETEYNNDYKELALLNTKALLKELLGNDQYDSLDLESINDIKTLLTIDIPLTTERLADVLRREAISRNYSPAYIEALELDENGEFKFPLWASPAFARYQSVLLSLIDNNINKRKMPGMSAVLASEKGFTSLIESENSGIVFTDKWEGKLKYRNKNSGYSQVLISSSFIYKGKNIDFRNLATKKDGKLLLDPKRVDPEVLKMFGFRIPTQGHNSMAMIEVVGFLPPEMTNLVIAPMEFVAQMGSDFDVDKLYLYRNNVTYEENDDFFDTLEAINALVEQNLTTIKSDEFQQLREDHKELSAKLKELKESRTSDKVAEFIEQGKQRYSEYVNGNNKFKIKLSLPSNDRLNYILSELDSNMLNRINNARYNLRQDDEVEVLEDIINEVDIDIDMKELSIIKAAITSLNESIMSNDERKTYRNIKQVITDAYKTFEGNKKAKALYLAERQKRAIKRISLYKGDDQRKLLQNKIFSHHDTVLSNLDPEIVYQNTKPLLYGDLDSDEMVSLATTSLNRRKGSTNLITPLSPDYQRDKYLQARSGKAGTGSFSLDVVFISQSQGKNLQVLESNSKQPINANLGSFKANDFLNQLKVNKGNQLVFDTAVAYQSVAVDNENKQLFGLLNINEETFDFIRIAVMYGHTEKNIQLFLMQDILFEYVEKLKKNRSNLSKHVRDKSRSVRQAKEDVIREYLVPLLYKVDASEITNEQVKEFKQNIDNYRQENKMNEEYLSNLIENGIEAGNIEQIAAQYNILDKFIKLSEASNTIRNLEQASNVDASGMGGDLATSLGRYNITFESDNYTLDGVDKVLDANLSNEDASINLPTIHHHLGLRLGLQLFNEHAPISTSAMEVTERIISENPYSALGTKAQVYKTVYKNYIAFINSSSNNPLIRKHITSVTSGRHHKSDLNRLKSTLLYDNETPSLATIVGIAKTHINNYFLNNIGISREYRQESNIKFTGSNDNGFVDFNMLNGLAELYNNPQTIGDFYNVNYTTRDLVIDIMRYTFLFTDITNPNSLARFIPVNLLRDIGYVDFLNNSQNLLNINQVDDTTINRFTRQFYQNNPEFASKTKDQGGFTASKGREYGSGNSMSIYQEDVNASESVPTYKIHDGVYPLLYELREVSERFVDNNTEKVTAFYELIPSSYQFLSAYNYDTRKDDYTMNEIDVIMYIRNIVDNSNSDKVFQLMQVLDQVSMQLTGQSGLISFFNERKSYSGSENFNEEMSQAIQTLVSFMYKNPKVANNFVGNVSELENVIDPDNEFDETEALVSLYVAKAIENAQTPLSHVRFDHNANMMGAQGYYDSVNNTIVLSPYHTSTAQFTKTLVHESLHYLTVDTIRNPKTQEQKEAVERLTKFQSSFARDLENNNEHFKSVKEKYEAGNGISEEDMIYYPFLVNNIDELMVALFDQPKFRKWAKSFEYEGDKNLLDKLMSLLGRLFNAMNLNLKPKDGNLSLEYMLADASVIVNPATSDLIKGNAANMNYVNYKGDSYIAYNYNNASNEVDLVRVRGNEVETTRISINDITVTRSDVSLSKDRTGRIFTPRSIIDPVKKTVIKRDQMKQESLLSKYTLHSGGAKGSDYFWSTIGNKFGMSTSRHYYVEGYKTTNGNTPVSILINTEADSKILKANKTLKRSFPTRSDYVNSLIRRNWMQVKNADAVFAVSRIGENNLVEGGTGWAVQMAIDENKPTHVYDMNDNQWKKWDSENKQWNVISTPILTSNFAGIGSREITPQGVEAIRDVYNTTEANLQNDVLFLPSTFNALNELDEC